MPSIFEKPSLLGFRAEGGAVGTPEFDLAALERSLVEAEKSAADAPRRAELEKLRQQFNALAATARGDVQVGTGSEEYYPIPIADRQAALNQIRELMPQIQKLQPAASEGAAAIAAANDTYEAEANALPSSTTPLAQSMFAAAALAAANDTYEAEANALPPSPSMFSAPPAGSRAANIAAAKASGDFSAKQRQYNQEAMRMGHPSKMDDQGNIVGRELTQEEQMRDAFMRTGGNTPFLQTNDPMQRALQNEMMKQARGQIAANTFGFTPEERRANLEEEVNARKILATPLDSGVREVAPGVRGAFRNGQAVGFATNQAPPRGPNGESTATMNDPLKKYITNPDGSVSLNPNPPQIRLADEMKDTLGRQKIEGKTGGSPMERGLIAAMAAEEARKKKLAEDARKAAAFSAQGAANIAAANSTYEAEANALPPAAPVAPGFRQTTPSGQFAENFGYGAAPVASSAAAPGFRATTPSGQFAENFGYGAAPAAPVASPQSQAAPAVNANAYLPEPREMVITSNTGAKDNREALGKPRDKKKQPRGPTYFDVPLNAENQRALELAKQLVAPAAPAVAAPAAPDVAASTGAKDSRKTLGNDKTKKVVRGPTYFEVPPNTTNQRARG